MVRNTTKWRFSFIFVLLVLNVFTKSLPIDKSLPALDVSDSSFPKLEVPKFEGIKVISDSVNKLFKIDEAENTRSSNETVLTEDDGIIDGSKASRNRTRSLMRTLRPGQDVYYYSVEISFDGDTFHGRTVIDLRLTFNTREDPIVFHLEGLDVHEVRTGTHSEENTSGADFDTFDGIIEIFPQNPSNSHIVIIEYSGQINNFGRGIFQGDFNGVQYIGMNLHPTNARRVFPCLDELQSLTTISFTFENVPFADVVSNSIREDGNEFRDLQIPPHLWGMVAHSFPSTTIISNNNNNVILYGRSVSNQDNLLHLAINHLFTFLNEIMNKNYFEINVNQDGRMHIFALPDTNVEWNALSTVCIWEPYILLRNAHSMMQRKITLVNIAEAMARQWYGYVVYPEDWKHQWVISGLVSNVAQKVVNDFQSAGAQIEDITLLDMNTIFITDVIQEALLHDAYSAAVVLSPDDNLVDEADIRHYISRSKFKAPAIMRMLRLVLGDEDDDFIQRTGETLLNRWAQTPISVFDFYDAVPAGFNNIDNVEEFLEPWIKNTGYPLLHVAWRSANTIFLSQEHFKFTDSGNVGYSIPITFTTNIERNYDNVHPIMMMDNTIQTVLPNTLGDDDYVIFNIQGQGFYRVNYDTEYWDRIIGALDDPDRRQEIHPLNRATLIDDALNLARAGKLDYDIALRLVLTWGHETEYAPWKAYIRNMEYIKKGLLGDVIDDDDLDPNIYTRLIRRTIAAFEEELSFSPAESIIEPAMTTLTRGIVMDHVCRSNYIPCIAAAIDWFYDHNGDELAVNPNIPMDIQPAVFCTMVREAQDEATDLLYAYLETDLSHYDRLVVLESLACSQDGGFIDRLMMDTISQNGPFGVEERSKVLAAVIRSEHHNVNRVINFMQSNTNSIRDMYGGPQKLEELVFILADNIINGDLEFNFRIWVQSGLNNLGDSENNARRALEVAQENLDWHDRSFGEIYEWIDENDAHTIVVSSTLLCFTVLFFVFNL